MEKSKLLMVKKYLKKLNKKIKKKKLERDELIAM